MMRPRRYPRASRSSRAATGVPGKLRAGVLSTVVVVSALMLLLLAGVLWLWDADFLLFSRTNYMRIQLANIESAFTLYRNDPGIMDRLDADSTFVLYDSLPGSRVKIACKPWGLYEQVGVTTADGRVHSVRLMAAAQPGKNGGTFWYKDNSGALTLSGNTNLQSKAFLPKNGVIYGQMQSVFFSGEKLDPADVAKSEKELVQPLTGVREIIHTLLDSQGDKAATDSLRVDFYNTSPAVIDLGSGTLAGCYYAGNIILLGDKLHIDPSCRLQNIIVSARSVSVADGFKGRMQVFATDTVIVGAGAELAYPSGVYAGRYAEMGDSCRVNGYLIVDLEGNPGIADTPFKADIKKPNLRKARTSRLRGLLWTDGIAMLQGIVTGAAILGESVYYSPQGYYRHMLYDASVLECPAVGYPLWLDAPKRRKEAVWVE